MIKIVWLGLLIYIAFLLFSHWAHDFQPETQQSDSENDLHQKDKMNMELKKFYEGDVTSFEGNYSKYEKLVKTLDNYIQRYISLFLITSNLIERQVKDPNEMITVDLELTLRGEDLTFLQEFSKLEKNSAYLKKLSKLDAIFSQIARLKKRSYLDSALRYSKSFLADIIFRVLKNPYFNHFLPLIIIFMVMYVLYIFLFHKPFVTAVILLNSLIFWDSLNLYWKRIKEVDLNIYVKSMQFKEIPEDCYPSDMSWYQHLSNLFGQNRCLQYIQNLNKNPVEEVSILMCLIDTYSNVLVLVPTKVLGASIRDFTGEIGKLWPWPFSVLVSIPLSLIITVFAGLFILILCGKRFRLSFLGAAVEVGDVKPALADKDKTATITDASAKNDVRNPRKLKPWTLVGLPKPSEDSAPRRNSLLKVSESSAALPDDIKENASEPEEKLNSENSNVQPKEDSIVNQGELFNESKLIQGF